MNGSAPGTHEPVRIGGYTVLDKVGSGTIWAAYDPQLDRRVCLKRLDAPADDESRSCIRREAQAMATVSHPNVAHVYEVGEHGRQLYMAMEYVRGTTLDDWGREAGRHWADIVALIVQAGRGLHAAHVAGVVHGAFTPRSAIVGTDGRVRVVDFAGATREGAEATGEPTLAAMSDTLPTPSWSAESPYVAPEQLQRQSFGAEVDQFALCVTLYELLCGRRPFEDDAARGLAEADLDKRLPGLPREVPRWLEAVLVRGLQAKPRHRFASMNQLVSALTPRQRRSKLAWTGILLAGAGLAGWASMRLGSAVPHPCPDPGVALEGIWDDDARAHLRSAFMERSPHLGPMAWPGIRDALDGYARDWVEAHQDACEATHVHRVQSASLLDARVQCLENRLQHLEALTMALGQPATKVERARAAVGELPSVTRCADTRYVQTRHPLPEDVVAAARIRAQQRRLARVEALRATGRHDEARQVAREVSAHAATLQYLPLSIHAELAEGLTAGALADLDAAIPRLESTYQAGRRHHVSGVAAEAAAELSFLLSRHKGQPATAKVWALASEAEATADNDLLRMVRARNAFGIASCIEGVPETYEACGDAFRDAIEIAERLGSPLARLSAQTNYGRYLRLTGKLDAAESLQRQLVADKQALLGKGHPEVIVDISMLADVALVLGHDDGIEALVRGALEVAKRTIGPDHPTTLQLMEQLGALLIGQGRLGDARRQLEDVVDNASRSKNPGERKRGLGKLARVYQLLAQPERAAALLRQELEILGTMEGDARRDEALVRGELARLLIETDELDEAKELADQCVAGFLEHAWPRHVETAEAYKVRADVALAHDDLPAARLDLERAMEIRAAELGDDAKNMAMLYEAMSDLERRSGRAEAAVTMARRALKVQGNPAEGVSYDVGRMQFLLARALEAAGAPAEDIRTALDASLRHLEPSLPVAASRAARVREWAAAHDLATGPGAGR